MNRKTRVALYSHDTMGLGHIRRNIFIAHALAASNSNLDILILAGAVEAKEFALPEGVDCLVMPSLFKESDGRYRARRLGISLNELIHLRSKTLRAAIKSFDPDVLIVDTVPRGASHELDATLKYLRKIGRTRCVLGLRDIRDEPDVVKREWLHGGYEETVLRCYDEIWVYGDENVYNPISEYGYSSQVAKKIRCTGYFDQRIRLTFEGGGGAMAGRNEPLLPDVPFVLCMVGGGQDGTHLTETFAATKLPPGMVGVLLTGPHMDPLLRARLHIQAAANSQLRVLEFVAEPAVLLDKADCVITMGGYNSVSESLSFGKPTLIVPRVRPRKEQLIRAQRLRSLGVMDMLHPDRLSPDVLAQWIGDNAGQSQRNYGSQIDMNGVSRLPKLFARLLQ